MLHLRGQPCRCNIGQARQQTFCGSESRRAGQYATGIQIGTRCGPCRFSCRTASGTAGRRGCDTAFSTRHRRRLSCRDSTRCARTRFCLRLASWLSAGDHAIPPPINDELASELTPFATLCATASRRWRNGAQNRLLTTKRSRAARRDKPLLTSFEAPHFMMWERKVVMA